jgi:anti-sigma B factor antagonist
VTLRISGVLDAITAPDMRPAIEEIAGNGVSDVVIDLSELSLIDSSGVAALVSVYKQMKARDGRVRLIGVKDQPLAILRLLRLDRVFFL